MKMKLLVGIAILLGISTTSHAEFNGIDLWNMCASGAKGTAVCKTWITGFQSGLYAARVAGEAGETVCLPKGFTGNQAHLIVEKFMRDHPQLLNNSADVVAFTALSLAFPCKKP